MDPIMLTQLTTDLCRILKHDLARFDNDASVCYDRIIVALGMLAARRCGMPANAIRLHADDLQFMRYTVKQDSIWRLRVQLSRHSLCTPFWNRSRQLCLASGLAILSGTPSPYI